MEENKQGTNKPTIDKEYLKKLAEKIKAEKARKESLQKQSEDSATPPPPPLASIASALLDDDDEEEMASEKTAIIDLTALSGHSADARLTILDGKDEGKSIDITRDEIFAGRSLDNDFVISDISVSRKHFKVTREGDHFVVSDMGSGNGIRVNGAKLSSATLYDGDVVTAGARRIKFEILNEEMKEKYSREEKADGVQSAEFSKGGKKSSSILPWVAIFVVLTGLVGGGYLFMKQSEQIQQVAAEFKLGIDDVDKIDDFIEQKDFKSAEKNVRFFLEKVPNNKQLAERLVIIEKEKKVQEKFEQGKVIFSQNKDEGSKILKEIPEESVFYDDVKTLVGADTITVWLVSDIKELVKEKKDDEALKKIYAALTENPDNEEIKNLQQEITSKLGEEKAKDIQAKAAAEKKAAEEKRAALQREKAARVQAARQRAARAQAVPQPRPAAARTQVAPAASASTGGSAADIDRAIELYLSKDFGSAMQSLDKAMSSNDKELSKKAQLLKIEVQKFRKWWTAVQSERGKKKNATIRRLTLSDKKISGGQLEREIEALGDSGTATTRPAPAARGAAKMSDDEAKELYMKARSMRNQDPSEARRLLQKVVDETDSSSDYNKKSRSLIKSMK
ncbi:MAG: FHA domain-containing protein [bacterium]